MRKTASGQRGFILANGFRGIYVFMAIWPCCLWACEKADHTVQAHGPGEAAGLMIARKQIEGKRKGLVLNIPVKSILPKVSEVPLGPAD